MIKKERQAAMNKAWQMRLMSNSITSISKELKVNERTIRRWLDKKIEDDKEEMMNFTNSVPIIWSKYEKLEYDAWKKYHIDEKKKWLDIIMKVQDKKLFLLGTVKQRFSSDIIHKNSKILTWQDFAKAFEEAAKESSEEKNLEADKTDKLTSS